MSDYARKLIGIDAVTEADPKLTGEGEVVGVIDSGVDAEHPDLKDRVKESVAAEGADAVDESGHGTHVCGTIAGTGKASEGKVRGMAPGAELVVLGITNDAGELSLPADLGDLLRQTADRGAKIINLSWGTPLDSLYDNGSMAIDCFVRERPDVLVVVAAGNQGAAPKGYPDLWSVGTPATAKDVLTVGACSTSRPKIKDTWGAYKPQAFPAAPTKDYPLAGKPDLAAALSSRGPTDFDSVKPDLVAPGTAILAPRASGAPERSFWKLDKDEHYGFMNGTSMATPVVTGAAAVVRQHLRTREHNRIESPSAALLKAVLLAGAHRLPWHRPKEDEADFGYPDFDQGFGRIDLATILPVKKARPKRRLCAIDVPDDSPEALESRAPLGDEHKAVRRYRLEVPKGAKEPLRIVLAWSDPKNAAVQNSLSLDVQGPDGLRLTGNQGHLWMRPPAKYLKEEAAVDKRNNVQIARIDKPKPGAYTVRILARNTLFPPQGYALCVAGELESDPEAQT